MSKRVKMIFPVPMSEGTGFANVLLVAQPPG